jgi:HK97 family phage major capsid protein
MTSDAKVLAFGDLSRYVARGVGGLKLERSADFLFGKNQLAVRGISRIDAKLTDPTAVDYLHQNVT